jgi:two-component system sensor histidine kinase KdpD
VTVHRLAGQAYPYGVSLLIVGAFTGAIALIRSVATVDNASMLYLLAVLVVAVTLGSGPAMTAAVASFLAFNFFFVEPRNELAVADGDEWVALMLLLVTGLVTGRLASSLRDRAREAERREQEAVVLYDVVRLMGEPKLQRALTSVAERLRVELAQSAVMITFGQDHAIRAQADSGDPESLRLAREALQFSGALLTRGAEPTAATRGETGRWVKVMPPTRRTAPGSDRARRIPIVLGSEEVGALVLVSGVGAAPFGREEDRLLSVVAQQLGRTFERLRLQREANEAEVLRRTDELRAALMNAVSHDLRTPLSSIIASAGSLLQDEVEWTKEERRDFLRAIESEAERLNRLVGNLLDLSRIEAGTLKPEMGWYDLGSLLEELAGRLADPDHTLCTEVPAELPPLKFDYVEIDQALTNLVENAVKHTPAGTTITVSVNVAEGQVRIEIVDDGPGIPAGALPRIFDPFVRAAPDGTRATGSGLGLAVAQGFIEAHGGTICAENRVSGGARFIVTLPAPAAGTPAPEVARP